MSFKATQRRVLLALRRSLKPAVDAVAGALAVGLLKAVRLVSRTGISRFAGGLLRRIGPWLREHRIGRDNLRAAFPEKSDAEIETILAGVWENLGRIGAEFAHLDDLTVEEPGEPGQYDIVYGPETMERFLRLRDDGLPALIFASHIGNWEIPALIAASYGLDTAILYRRPNNEAVDAAISRIRAVNMGTLVAGGPDAPFRLARALDRGQHVAMLVDQHYGKGVDVTFFGRTCKANPMLAMLARHYDCPIHGVRVVRLPDGRFRVDLTEAIAVPRAPNGWPDVRGTMQAVTSVIEGWVREYPEQWLWLHRRWR